MEDMSKKNTVRVRPRTFEDEWKEDLLSRGIKIPDAVEEMRYSPVAHSPMPFSIVIDLDAMTLVKRIIGVIPNAYAAKEIISWEEFCKLIGKEP